MPKKPKQTEAPAEEHLEEAAATPEEAENITIAYPPPPESDWKWPVSTEGRSLIAPHTDHHRSEIALQMGKLQEHKESVEDAKKASASNFKAQLDSLEERMSQYAAVLAAGGERRTVPCRWIFETSGRDSDGEWVRHAEYKSLVREDTGEVVETVRISEDDRQATLELGDDEAALEALLAERGWVLKERESVEDEQTPFFIESLPDAGAYIAMDTPGDSRLAALKAAVSETAPQDCPEADAA
jgi:hypothetical protein